MIKTHFYRVILFSILSVFTVMNIPDAIAVPAAPGATEIEQPDGRKVKIHLRGDEFFSWHEDEHGYVVQRDKRDGNWKYASPKTDTAGFDIIDGAEVGIADPAVLKLKKHNLPRRELLREHILRVKMEPAPSNPSTVNPDAAPSPAGVEEGLTEPPPQGVPVSGTKTIKNIVILAAFSDHWTGSNNSVNTTYTRIPSEYTNLFDQVGYTTDGAIGSVKDYYKEVSYNKLTVDSVVTNWIQLPQNQAYYGADGTSKDTNWRQMIIDAVNAAEAAGFDFSQGDSDSDGWVDCLTVIHSGYGQEYTGNSSECVWSKQGSMGSVLTVDGVKLYRCHTEPAMRGNNTSAITRIGVICHEMGHFFGLPDLYDYSSQTNGLGYWCVMSNGSWGDGDGNKPSHFSAWCKYMLGFVKPTIVHSKTGISLPRVEDNATIHMYLDGMSNGEYFLVENRAKYGFDNSTTITAAGILIYHIDSKSANNDLGTWSHPAVKIEEADGNNSIGIPYPTTGWSLSQAGDVWTSTSGLSGGFRDQTGDQDCNSMLYQAAHFYNRSDNSAYYSYLGLSNFSAAGANMTYNVSTLKPTVADGTSSTGNYTVNWGACTNATLYEIQEGSPVTLTSFSDGAESDLAMYDNWSTQGDARRTNGGARTGSYSYLLQYYDSVSKFYSAVQGLTMRNNFNLKSNTVLSFYITSQPALGYSYIKYQVSNDNGNTWKTLGTDERITSWTQRSYNYSAINASGINLNDSCIFRFITNFEAASN
ncbi:MAG: M6 family metalloprotease domain-containing protein, partial [Lentisphaerota bacterium]